MAEPGTDASPHSCRPRCRLAADPAVLPRPAAHRATMTTTTSTTGPLGDDPLLPVGGRSRLRGVRRRGFAATATPTCVTEGVLTVARDGKARKEAFEHQEATRENLIPRVCETSFALYNRGNTQREEDQKKKDASRLQQDTSLLPVSRYLRCPTRRVRSRACRRRCPGPACTSRRG